MENEKQQLPNKRAKACEQEEEAGDASPSPSMEELQQSLLKATAAGDLPSVQRILDIGLNLWFQDPDPSGQGRSCLHIAAERGDEEMVRALLQAGHPWNILDSNGRTAGEYAERAGHSRLYEFLLNEGCRVELLLGILGRKSSCAASVSSAGKKEGGAEASNKDYLSQRLRYEDNKLLDEENNAVMMGWEAPLMRLHAEMLCPREGLDVLNVGFGLGIIDELLQERKPRRHVIIEAHADVYAHMLEKGWDKKPGVHILFGRWQDVMPSLLQGRLSSSPSSTKQNDEEAQRKDEEKKEEEEEEEVQGPILFDGIFFDTFGEYYEDLREFHEHVPDLLRYPNGIYSFFNGLGATNKFFYEVYCRVSEADLKGMGLTTTYQPIKIDPSEDKSWEGVKGKYWQLETYHLPRCTYSC
ncbi:Arginine N-methyltransferase 2 [Balamuthia mandrillaris]